MKLSELLHSDVFDADGRNLGSVDDVLFVQDGPYVEGFGAALRVAGLVVGRGAIAVRLGYHRAAVSGPWLLRRVFGALERRTKYVPWEDVTDWDGERVTVGVRGDELAPPDA